MVNRYSRIVQEFSFVIKASDFFYPLFYHSLYVILLHFSNKVSTMALVASLLSREQESLALLLTAVSTALERPRQESNEFKTSLCYIVVSCFKNKEKRKENERAAPSLNETNRTFSFTSKLQADICLIKQNGYQL